MLCSMHPACASDRCVRQQSTSLSKPSTSQASPDDSCMSAHDVLLCVEDLASLTYAEASHDIPTLLSAACQPTSGSEDHQEVYYMIRNDLRREADIRPQFSSSVRNPQITTSVRALTVSWMAEVADELQLQQETLFMAVSYFDRYLSVSQDVFTTMVQLVAVACMAVAVKHEETYDILPATWIELTMNAFKMHDLHRMECLLLVVLDWRTATPTLYSFLHLLSRALASSSAGAAIPCRDTLAVAAYLAELSLLDDRLVTFPYSTVACAALLLADGVTRPPTAHGGVDPATAALAAALQDILPGLDMGAVCHCMVLMESLITFAGGAGNGGPAGADVAVDDMRRLDVTVVPIQAKYARERWLEAAAVVSERYGVPLAAAAVAPAVAVGDAAAALGGDIGIDDVYMMQ